MVYIIYIVMRIMVLIFVLGLVLILGYLAQSIGLCMVRGVNEWKHGKPEFIIAILLSGVLAWVAFLYSAYSGTPTQFKTYEASVWFALGGLFFGVGAAFNQGCGVSTLSKLTRGDLRMTFTIFGWLIGWSIIERCAPSMNHTERSIPSNINIVLLIATSVALLIWSFIGNKSRRKLWLTMMTIGLIGGFVFLYDPKWTPSGLLHKISHSVIKSDANLLPLIESYFIFISLLIGMFVAAWRTKKF